MVFGGFIVTYNRPELIVLTLQRVFSQTFPPKFIFVIDNSDNLETSRTIGSLYDPRVKYHRMGHNAGPAGAASKGLQLCLQEGAEWIFWGDDNDPPQFEDTFERLFSIKDDNPYCGIIGAVGHFFDHKKGEIKRIQSRLLERKKSLEVECIAGGMSMIVHKRVVQAGILPDPTLFFGFEELDFCLKAKRRGIVMLVNCELFLALRKLHDRTEFERPLYKKKSNPVREYYSLRNLLYISDSLTLKAMKKRLILKWLAKSFYGFKYGVGYGVSNFRMIWLAFYHYSKNKRGYTLPLK